jgi:hypothetical protein
MRYQDLENCWGYSTPVDDWRGGGRPGTGAFVDRAATASADPTGPLVPDPRYIPNEELPAVELDMLEANIGGFQEGLAGVVGISPVRRLDPPQIGRFTKKDQA